MNGNEQYKYTIKIENSVPVELRELTTSYLGFHDQFNRYIKINNYSFEDGGPKLCVNEIRPGCIETSLIVIGGIIAPVLPFISNVNTVITFGKHLRSLMLYFLGKGKRPDDLQIPDCKNCAKIATPIASDPRAVMNFTANEGGTQNFYLTHIGANAVQNAAKREMKELGAPEQDIYPKVILHWYQARDESGTTTGDKAIIDRISQKPLKVIFEDDRIKDEMIRSQKNPFLVAFVVDVQADTINGKLAAYRILNLHEVFEKPPE